MKPHPHPAPKAPKAPRGMPQIKGVPILVDIIGLVPGTAFEVMFIREQMENGKSFWEAMRELSKHYDEQERLDLLRRLGIPDADPKEA